MQQFISELYNSLVEATSECKTNYLSLSGGLDSTIIAYLLREKIHGVSVIVSDYSAPDNTFIEIARDALKRPENKEEYRFGDFNPSVSVRNYSGRGGHETWGEQQ